MKYILEPFLLTSLEHSVFRCSINGSRNKWIMVLCFSGKPGIGSEGNGDAAYIKAVINTLFEGWIPDGLVADFSRVEYEFGDSMMLAMNISYLPDDLPKASVFKSVKKKKPLLNILKQIGFKEEKNSCYDSLEQAIESVERQCMKREE